MYTRTYYYYCSTIINVRGFYFIRFIIIIIIVFIAFSSITVFFFVHALSFFVTRRNYETRRRASARLRQIRNAEN